MVSALANAITMYPTSFGIWACLLQEIITGTSEIAVVGTDFIPVHTELLRQYIPHKVSWLQKKLLLTFPIISQ